MARQRVIFQFRRLRTRTENERWNWKLVRPKNWNSLTLQSSRVTSSTGSRAFSVAGPQAWNQLPASLRHTNCVVTFKRHLKTVLFKAASVNCSYVYNATCSAVQYCKRRYTNTSLWLWLYCDSQSVGQAMRCQWMMEGISLQNTLNIYEPELQSQHINYYSLEFAVCHHLLHGVS